MRLIPFSWYKKWHCDAEQLVAKDLQVHGKSFFIMGTRSWFNPLRWIVGSSYSKRLDPRKVYIEYHTR